MPKERVTSREPFGHLGRIVRARRSRMRGWDFDLETLERALRGEVMPNPSLDLGNPCNLNCPYCFIEEKLSPRKIRRPDELTTEETRRVIDDFHQAGARTVNIVGAGEPTIDPHFEEVVVRIGRHGMVPVVFTNGIRIAREPSLVRFLYRHDSTVVLKLNSRDDHLQDLVAGRPGYTRLRDEALELLLEAGFAAHSPTRLAADTLAFKGNLRELRSIYRWCLEQNIHPIIGEYIPTGRTEGGRFAGHASLPADPEIRREAEEALQPLSPSDRLRLALEIGRISEEFVLDPGGPCAYYGGEVCTQVLGVYVDILGSIWPCVARSMVRDGRLMSGLLGRLRDGDRLSRIWREHPFLEERRARFDGGCPYKAPPWPAGKKDVQPEEDV